jgi:hypothetical protein
MMLKSFTRLVSAATVFILLFVPPTSGATLEHHLERNQFGCDITLRGEIESGDRQQLERLQQEIWPGESGANEGPGDGGVLCLDSPGGNLAEAIAMASIRNGPTIVPPGATCESACSIVFMAGNINETPSRMIFQNSLLGFHAPKLLVPEGSFTDSQVSEAYDTAIETIAEVAALDVLPPSAFRIFSSTPNGQMGYISTFRDLIENQISLVQLSSRDNFYAHESWSGVPNIPFSEMFTNACKNYYQGMNYGRDPIIRSWDPVEVREPQDRSWGRGFDLSGLVFIHQAEEYYEPCEIRLSFYIADTGISVNGSVEMLGRPIQIDNRHIWPQDARFSRAASRVIGEQGLLRSAAAASPEPISCTGSQGGGRIVNVQNFVNMRNGPGFDFAIMGQIPLGARVSVPENRVWATDRCIDSCRSGNVDEINRCIENDEVWIIVDYQGTHGTISRRFVEGVSQ